MIAPPIISTPFKPQAGKISYEDFRRLYVDQHVEWEEGEVITFMNNVKHQSILMFLSQFLGLYLGFKNLGRLYPAGVQMDLGPGFPHREPDLLVVLTANLGRVEANKVKGPADVAIEIVSPESHERDWGRKMSEYAAGGVGEYWIIDPLSQEVVFHRPGPDGHYQALPPTAEGWAESQGVAGFKLDPALLWQEELPQGAAIVAMVQALLA